MCKFLYDEIFWSCLLVLPFLNNLVWQGTIIGKRKIIRYKSVARNVIEWYNNVCFEL